MVIPLHRPLHRPPFKLGTVIARSLIPPAASRSLRQLEEAHVQASGCAEAIWLPSARAGICWALRAAIGEQTRVVGPAFTCPVVHEAMIRSGGDVRLIDADCATFGMETQTLRAAQTGRHALVLCEPYGHPYDLAQLTQNALTPAIIRIVDSAMAVPNRSLFDRLQMNDFAVVSFGVGKPAYAGWGAMGFTRDHALAAEVRKIRDSTLAQGGFRLTIQRNIKIALRTAAHYPWVYPLTLKLWYQAAAVRLPKRRILHQQPSLVRSSTSTIGFPAEWLDCNSYTPEWTLPSTYLDRSLALWNLEHADSFYAVRLALAERYHKNLADAESIVRPPVSLSALSHYTVRVDANIQSPVREQLSRLGVHTNFFWAFKKFEQYLNPQEFPNAFRICSEVVNLPLSQWMTMNQVDEVCELLLKCVEDCSKAK